jgi:RimJ/RimL family protein N-acetyltransferase
LAAVEEISTRRLVLRRFRESDVGTLAAYRSDPDVARFQSWDAPFPLADAERMVREMSDSAAPEPAEGTLAEAFGHMR